MVNLTIRIPDQLRRDLEKVCREQDRPVGQVVREFLRRCIAMERFRALRRKTLPFAEAQGILTDEDVLEIVS